MGKTNQVYLVMPFFRKNSNIDNQLVPKNKLFLQREAYDFLSCVALEFLAFLLLLISHPHRFFLLFNSIPTNSKISYMHIRNVSRTEVKGFEPMPQKFSLTRIKVTKMHRGKFLMYLFLIGSSRKIPPPKKKENWTRPCYIHRSFHSKWTSQFV